MARSEIRKRIFSPSLGLCLAIVASASMLYYHQGLFIPRSHAMLAARGLGNGYSFGNDFYQVWLSSRELLGRRLDPYSPEMTRQIQIGLYGRPLDPNRLSDPRDRRVFPYPAFTDLLLWPASQLPFSAVRIAVVCVLLSATVASVFLWLRVLGWKLEWKWTALVLLLTLTSYPALEGLFAGQLGLIVAFLLAASLAALKRQRFLFAGFLMALTAIKPQITLLSTIYMVFWASHEWSRRKKFITGLSATVFLLVGASLAVMPTWIRSWTQTVLAYRRYTTPPLVTEVVTSLLKRGLAEPASLVLTAAAVVIAVTLAWRNRKAQFGSSSFWLTLTILLTITVVFLLPGQAVYDHLILVPAVLLLARDRRQLQESSVAPRFLLIIGTAVLLWAYIAAFLLVVMRPWLSRTLFESAPVFALPIRAAASLPFAVLALLVWFWRINRLERQAAS